jgi:hypothetical protein
MKDQNPSRGGLSAARTFFAITPSDDDDLPEYPRAVWVGTGGDIELVGEPGADPVVLKNVADGTLLLISPTRITEGTTASDLVGWV